MSSTRLLPTVLFALCSCCSAQPVVDPTLAAMSLENAVALLSSGPVVDLHNESVAQCVREMPNSLTECAGIRELTGAAVDVLVVSATIPSLELENGDADWHARLVDGLVALSSRASDRFRVLSRGERFESAPPTVHFAVGIQGADQLGDDTGRRVWNRAVFAVAPVQIRESVFGPSLGRHPPSESCDVPIELSALVSSLCEADIALDISHMPACLARSALAEMPRRCAVIASHSGAMGVHRTERNLPDDLIAEIGRRGGIVGVPFYPALLNGSFSADVSDVADHVAYVAELAGVAHVGLGTDIGGFPGSGTPDTPGYADLPDLVVELSHRGFDEEAIRAVLGGNALEFLFGGD